MINEGLKTFCAKRILLLQGPVGPFFNRLAKDLRSAGAQVTKVNFNGGDWLYSPSDSLNYRDSMEDWPTWLSNLITTRDIDMVLLYGDCRPIHRIARVIAVQHGLEIGVFEEGYVRPDYITLERHGVNANSRLPRDPDWYQRHGAKGSVPTTPVGKTYWPMIWAGFCYFTAAAIGRLWFPAALHHRPIGFLQALPWLRSAWRKLWYRYKERGVQVRLAGQWRNHYYLVPLQVHNDTQITEHGCSKTVEGFMAKTLRSFADHAPDDTLLVFKHHPMDRGYRDYTRHIQRLVNEMGLADRVLYIHDQHLPTLLDNARGVVVVNSTVGLSSLLHGAPTKVTGRALYDLPGLTWQGSLDGFWQACAYAKPDRVLLKRFRQHLIAQTQLNGSFYKPLATEGTFAGLLWVSQPRPAALSTVETVVESANEMQSETAPHIYQAKV